MSGTPPLVQSDGYTHAERILLKQCDDLRAALRELCETQAYKEQIGKTAEYETRRDAAWARARELLSGGTEKTDD